MPKNRGGLSERQRVFCKEYIYDYNGARAARVAGYSEDSIYAIASENLTKPEIQEEIKRLQENLAETAGISKLMILNEHKNIIQTSIAHLHNSWITRKEFNELTEDQKKCIQEISTQVKTSRNTDGTLEENEYIKIKLYDRQKSMDSLSKMLGFDEAQKVELSGGVKSYKIVPATPRT